jgi:AcrR family transcriptional regulator
MVAAMLTAAGNRRCLSRNDWLEAGVAGLRSAGIAGVTIERLAATLGVTRGSFYHHFANREDLLREILAYWEQNWTISVREEVRASGLDPSNALLVLIRLIRHRRAADYDVAFRAWALHDPLARKAVRRVDELRLRFIRQLFKEIGFEKLEAENRARLLLYYEMCEPSVFAKQSAKLEDQLIGVRHAFLTAKGRAR